MSRPLWESLADFADKAAVDGRLTLKEIKLLRESCTQMRNWWEAANGSPKRNSDKAAPVARKSKVLS